MSLKKSNIFFISIIVLIVSFGRMSIAQEEVRSTIVEADGYVYLSEDKTIRQIRNEARMEAKRLALEKGQMFIKSITKVENYTLTYDLIESSAEGMLKILESKDYGITNDNRWHYWIKAEIRYVLKSRLPDVPGQGAKVSSGPLTVKIWSEKNTYRKGEQMRFFMQGNKDFYARVIYIDAKGNKFQLIPSKYRQDNFFKGNKTYKIPDDDETFSLTVSPPFGKERVVVYASTAQQGNISVKKNGDIFLVDENMSEVQIKTRGVSITPQKAAEFYETVCKIKTKK